MKKETLQETMKKETAWNNRPHRRRNPLTGEWVLVSPRRTRRPWLGGREPGVGEPRPPYDPDCHLCPGNRRAGGAVNPKYTSTHVFTNDFPALLEDPWDGPGPSHPLMRFEPVQGACRVICYSPRHDLTLAEMPEASIRTVVDLWARETESLGARYRWVQVFENKGEIMGCSNPHPHGQIWAVNTLPNEVLKEDRRQGEYLKHRDSVMLLEYARLETEQGERVVLKNDHWVVVVPFWAVWPFEVMVLPLRHVRRLPELNHGERDALAGILKRLLEKYDLLFNVSFPYSMGWHGAPMDDGDNDHWQVHAHFYPPLLRSATVKKFMVGYEMLGEAQRDLTPEQAAAGLREARGASGFEPGGGGLD